LFDVYDKNFTKITIKYIDYLNSKVCASEYVDYNKFQLKPNENGEVEVKYRMKRKMVKVEEIDLIDLYIWRHWIFNFNVKSYKNAGKMYKV
jgi:hypothetical protein